MCGGMQRLGKAWDGIQRHKEAWGGVEAQGRVDRAAGGVGRCEQVGSGVRLRMAAISSPKPLHMVSRREGCAVKNCWMQW